MRTLDVDTLFRIARRLRCAGHATTDSRRSRRLSFRRFRRVRRSCPILAVLAVFAVFAVLAKLHQGRLIFNLS